MIRSVLAWLAVALVLAGCGGGVGSGGTGIDGSAPMSYSSGSIQGLGSIIVNGVRYDTSVATVELQDATQLKLGMTVEVVGSVAAGGTEGTATRVLSAAELRGVVASVDAGSASFTVLGLRVLADGSTAFEGIASTAELRPGDAVQVYGLPGDKGELRATRVEALPAAGQNIASGAIEQLDTLARSFRIGALRVDYSQASVTGPLAPGRVVRVRGSTGADAGLLHATRVEPWSLLLPQAMDVQVNLSGVVEQFAGLDDFELAGVPVRAGQAQVTGGNATAIGEGVTVAATGHMSNGVLVARRIAIQHVPGSGGPSAFSVSGPVAAFQSPAAFMVHGQRVDASGEQVVFTGGTAADLRNGRQVMVKGSELRDGVLIAGEVVFRPDDGSGNSGGGGNAGGGDGTGNAGGGNAGPDKPGAGDGHGTGGGDGVGDGNAGGDGTGNCGNGNGNGNAACDHGNSGSHPGTPGGGSPGGNGNGNPVGRPAR